MCAQRHVIIDTFWRVLIRKRLGVSSRQQTKEMNQGMG
jgi:hypothetical protein